jgi:hypothetical protein
MLLQPDNSGYVINFFKRKEDPTPEPTCEQARADRREELLRKLAHINSEAEALSTQITSFLFQHKNHAGGYFADNLEELGALPAKELALRQREWLLNQERTGVLAELSTLTKNENESVHVEGKLVNDHAA